jgi:hypothetical protein
MISRILINNLDVRLVFYAEKDFHLKPLHGVA